MKKILNIAYYECVAIFHDRLLMMMVLLVPVMYSCIFGAIYFHPIITDIPTAIVDEDHSDLSRQIANAYRNSPAFSVREDITEYSDMEAAMRDGRIRAGIVIQKDLEQRVQKTQDAKVLAVYDASNLVWGYNIRKNVRLVINDFNTNWVANQVGKMGFDRFEQKQLLSPVSYNLEVWYNPTYSYANFMLFGLFLMIIHQISLLCIALSVPREREKGSWLQFQTAPVSRFTILIGKCLPYFLIFLLHYLLLLQIGIHFFHLSFEGSTLWLVLLGILYVGLMILLGHVVSYFVPNSLQGTRFIMLLSVPFVMMSGMIWPPTHISPFINGLAQLLPFTHAQKMMRILALKDGGWEQFGSYILTLLLMTGIVLVFFLLFCKKEAYFKEKDPQTVNCDTFYPTHKQ